MSSIVDALQAVLDDLQEHTPPHHRTPRGIVLACWAGLKVLCDQGRARLVSLVPVRAIKAMYRGTNCCHNGLGRWSMLSV